MPIEISRLVDRISPETTVLLFGAGSSAPSGVPAAAQVARRLAALIGLGAEDYSLSELASLVEQRRTRRELVNALRQLLSGAKPTGGLLNLPLYEWKSLYTTNFDDLIEQCYKRQSRDLTVYSSDFDFTAHDHPEATKLFKLHGSIEKDIVDGSVARLIVTEADYDQTGNFREALYDRLRGDMVGSELVIIGQSLQDADIRSIVNRAADLGSKAQGAWRLSLLLYTRDDNRAALFEKRGFTVCFGGVDDFFAELAAKKPAAPSPRDATDPLDAEAALRPVTVDVAHVSEAAPDFGSMFNGWPATHADVVAGFTFERNVAEQISHELRTSDALCAVLLGASGVGKTTAARQALQLLRQHGYLCWEHQPDHVVNVAAWMRVANDLANNRRVAALLLDDAHMHLPQINDLVDAYARNALTSIRLICVSTRNHWNPRAKHPSLFRTSRIYVLGLLQPNEIDCLLQLVDSSATIRALVEKTFSGFSRHERRRRLTERCASELFVCLKNIFASEKFDDIILREYADLDVACQEIYRFVAAAESAGIKVHRQLVMRLLGIRADDICVALQRLADIVHEYPISEKQGIYGWRSRHSVIAQIVARYKYPDSTQVAELLSTVIENTSPTYDVEVSSMRELCNIETGIPSIPDKSVQNTLLRKIISIVPGERVPRHRLIRNLIDMGEFEKAEVEIRIFEQDFRRDGPVARYRVSLLAARAKTTPGIMEEDRLAILEQAGSLAKASIQQFPYNASLLSAYCDVAIEVYRRTANGNVYEDAISELRAAVERIGDPNLQRVVERYESRFGGLSSEAHEPAEPVGDAYDDP